MKTDNRNIVLNILLACLYEDRFCHLVIADELKKHSELEPRDKRFIEHLSRGVIERKLTLEAVIGKVSSTKIKKMKPVIACILYMGIYQLLFMETEAFAAVSESVRLAKKRGLQGLSGFVNGVLRKVSSEGEKLLSDLKPWQLYSLPEPLYERFVTWYGQETADEMCGAFLSKESGRTCIRRNRSRCSDEILRTRLAAEGMQAENTGFSDDTYFLSGIRDLSDSPAFSEGLFYVQDLSSALSTDEAADILAGGAEVLDCCAAPGGKSIHAADLMDGKGHVTSCDVSERKVKLICENIRRSGFHNMEACVRDAGVFDPSLEGKFDLVILDVPCSGLGIIGNKPDIRYHVTEESLESIVQLQKKLLENCFRYVKDGGTLLYSTCTVNPAENTGMVRDYHPVKEIQRLPGRNYPGTGFYTARILKKAEHD